MWKAYIQLQSLSQYFVGERTALRMPTIDLLI